MAKTILITGGAGFIGSNFLHHILSRYPDYRIHVLDALTYAGSVDSLPPQFLDSDDPNFTFWYGDVCNAELVNTLVAECDLVLHFAAETHVTRSIFDNAKFFHTDVIGTHTVASAVLRAGSRIERFVHISTSEVYGTASREAMDEDHPLNPMSPYASAKCGADRLVYSYWQTYGLPVVIVRPFNTFGPRQHLEKVIPRFITSMFLGEELTVHGSGKAARDFVFVEDVCQALDLIMKAPDKQVHGQIFNVASGQSRAIIDVAQDIVRLMDSGSGQIVHMRDRPGQVLRHTGDTSKIERVLSWEPLVDWEAGLRRTIDWYSANPEWWRQRVWMRKIPLTFTDGHTEYH